MKRSDKKAMESQIQITKPFLPPREEFETLIDGVWNRNWLTNNGPLVQRLEDELCDYLDVTHLNFLSNGTIALQIAVKVLGLKGEIITTPFSYVATTSSIVWEGCMPVFADIDPDTLNIDPAQIEVAVTEQTSAILATHVFGNPCDMEAIREIADRHGLKVIYDAAHCFGTRYKGKSIFSYGDISIASFHATKIYHTVEGGAIVTGDPEIHARVGKMRNFGHSGPGNFEGLGINGKNSEFHAAMGICNLNHIDDILERRKSQWLYYRDRLDSGSIRTVAVSEDEFNFSYYPIILDDEEVTMKLKENLEAEGIYPRRYFWPSLSELEYLPESNPVRCLDISSRILCLPLYHDMQHEEQEKVVRVITQTLSEGS